MDGLAEGVSATEATPVFGDVVLVASEEAERGAQTLLASELKDMRVVTAPDPAAAAEVGAELVVMFMKGPADVRVLAGAVPRPRIVVVSADESSSGVRRLLGAGADAIVSIHEWSIAMAPVCRAVMAGHVCVPGRNRRSLDVPALSLRERQVLALMADGLNTAQIAERLFLAPSTVKSHSASAFRRLGVNSRREAVALVLGSDDALRRIVLTAQHGDGQTVRGVSEAVR